MQHFFLDTHKFSSWNTSEILIYHLFRDETYQMSIKNVSKNFSMWWQLHYSKNSISMQNKNYFNASIQKFNFKIIIINTFIVMSISKRSFKSMKFSVFTNFFISIFQTISFIFQCILIVPYSIFLLKNQK